MKRVPIALAGTGGMVRRHLNGLELLYGSDICNVELAAIYGRTRHKAEALADRAAVQLGQRPRVFDDLGTLSREMPSIQGVDIVTDAGSHHAVATDSLEAGLHVLIEKPLALTVRACDSLIALAQRQDRILSVAENWPRDPMYRLARALIDDGAIGTPRWMVESRVGGGDELFITPWRHKKLFGTVALDVGVHCAALLEHLMGSVETIYGEGRIQEAFRQRPDTRDETESKDWTDFYPKETGQGIEPVEATGEDALYAQLRFESGALGQWVLDLAGHCPLEWRRIVYGSKASISCPQDRSGEPIVLSFANGKRIADAEILDYCPSYRLDRAATALFGEARPWCYTVSRQVGDARLLALELHEFGECIATGQEPEMPGEYGRRQVTLVNAVFESGLLGQPVSYEQVASNAIDTYQQEIDAHYGLV